MQPLKLLSFRYCPFVQRSEIVLQERGVHYERVEIDLSYKPEWFSKLSPHGKVPVLLIDGEHALFESSAIAEYLDETQGGARLHPQDPLHRAQDRARISSSSEIGGALWRLVTAVNPQEGEQALDSIRLRLTELDGALGEGPYFRGPSFSLVDASVAPLLHHAQCVADILPGLGLFDGMDSLSAWVTALRERPSVRRTTPAGGQAWYRELVFGRHPVTRGQQTWLSTQVG